MSRLTLTNKRFFAGLEELINQGKLVQFHLKGQSMEPFIRDGRKITLSPVSSFQIALGDIVLARWQGKWILHRVIFKTQENLYLAGDGNLSQIEKIRKEDLVAILSTYQGKYGRQRKVGRLHKLFAMCWFLIRPIRILFRKLRLANDRHTSSTGL